MRIVSSAIAVAFFVCVFSASGAVETEVSFSLGATTDDKEFDLTLRSINTEAQQGLPSFYSSMNLNYGINAEEIDVLLYRHRLSPADAYMAIRLSVFIGKPIDYVIVRYHKHKKKGWGAIARSLGIKPGSAEFHKLKEGGIVVLERSRKERTQAIEVKVNVNDRDNGHHGSNDGKHEGGGKGKGRGKK